VPVAGWVVDGGDRWRVGARDTCRVAEAFDGSRRLAAMETLRTPEERFENLPGFGFERGYVEADGTRLGYVKADGDGDELFLCLHGEPTWSYLYRKMLPVLAERGRAVALDLPGLGRSDKWPEREDYTYERAYDAIEGAVEAMDLAGVTLVCQDWGGLLGLRVAARNPGRFDRLVPMNTGLPVGEAGMPDVWHQFREMVETVEPLDVGQLVNSGCVNDLDDDVLDAYRAPFPSEEYKAGARAYPGLVPTEPDHPSAAPLRDARERLADWDDPAFVLFSDSDPITRPSRDDLRELIPTASEQPDTWVEGGAHFLQEDVGEAVAEEIVDFVDRT
jgi:haloalkane dehalogenase